MKDVIIDGEVYVPKSEERKKIDALLSEVYGKLFIEGVYDPTTEDLEKFAYPLWQKMSELNDIMRFRK